MIFKLFDMIVAAIIALLGVNVPGPTIQPTASQSNATTVQPQPTGTKVTSTPATPTPTVPVPKTIGGATLPADAHPATDADLQKFMHNEWISTAYKKASLNFYESTRFILKGNELDSRRANGNNATPNDVGFIPDDARSFTGIPVCNTAVSWAAFEKNVMQVYWGPMTEKACGDETLLDEDIMKHFSSRPSLYFNADATYVYVQGGGTVSEWKYNEHPTPKASK